MLDLVALQKRGSSAERPLMTAVGGLLVLLRVSLAARRLCSITAHKRARVGGSEAAQGRREREGSLAALP